jgi:MFS family permease
MSASTAPLPVAWRDDAKTIGLVGLAHGTSHFHHLLLAPMFPWFIDAYGVNYAQLGLLMTVFFVVSGVGQAVAGFLVDRVGARPVLFGALICFCLASLAAANATGYDGLLLASGLAGLGNAPFHPVDFSIINRRVSPARLGHAYSVHGISGNLGWACAPLLLTGLVAGTGSPRLAYTCIAALPLTVLLLLVVCRAAVDDRVVAGGARLDDPTTAAGQPPTFDFLRLPAVWLCFAFLFFSTCALAAVQSFAGPALRMLVGLSAEASGLIVTGYMLSSAAGMVLGGFMLAQVQRAESLISAALCVAALLLLLVATGWVPGTLSLVLASAAGLGTGLAGPSRDLLIRRATPAGATGRVYGTVYSGLDLGFAMSAPVFGALLDTGRAGGIFAGAALALLAAVGSAWLIGLFTKRVRARSDEPRGLQSPGAGSSVSAT